MDINGQGSTSSTSFSASNKYASVFLVESSDSYFVKFLVTKYVFQDNITAIHIHSNVNDQPGPILIWLLTTTQWQSGVSQSTPAANSPCCIKIAGSQCDLTAPSGTMFKNFVTPGQIYTKIVPKNVCGDSCPGITQDSPHGFLVVHGNNFQTVEPNGCLSNGTAGIDVLIATPLNQTKCSSNTTFGC